MYYKFLHKLVAKEESRSVNAHTDTTPSEGHNYNFEFAKPYIKNKVILDIGCWTGQFERLSVGVAKKIFAIDPDKKAIIFAKKTIKGPIFTTGSATKLDFKNNTFDVVTLFDVLEHVPLDSELKCFKEIYRVLKPKGVLLIITPNKHPIAVLLDPAFWAFGHRHYSKKEMKNLLKSAKFEKSQIAIVGGLWNISTFIISMIAKHILKFDLEYPEYIKAKMRKEYRPGGITSMRVIATKSV